MSGVVLSILAGAGNESPPLSGQGVAQCGLRKPTRGLLRGGHPHRVETWRAAGAQVGVRRPGRGHVDGSGLSRRKRHVQGAKEPGRQAILELTLRTLDAVRAHKVLQNTELLQARSCWQDHNLMFPNTVDRPMNGENLYRREFQPLLEKAGLAKEGFMIHSLRHAFAATLGEIGVHPSTAQKMLGHSADRMTLAIYTRATEGMQDSAKVALEETFLDPAVDTPQKRGLGSSVESLYFSMICRTFRSGGTRIRTGDTMIFSSVAYFPPCIIVSVDSAKVSRFLHTHS